MNIFQIVNNLYTNKSSHWILDIPDKEISPFVIQRFLVMNERVKDCTRYLDGFVFHLKSKEYLALAWSILPKTDKAPYIKYIKKEKVNDNMDFLMPKIQKFFNMSNSDWDINESRIRDMLNKDTAEWFKFFGIRKYYWKKFGIDFNKIKRLKE